jgi:hypothetical protein
VAVLDIILNWFHILCAVILLGGMFLATFVLMPVLKANLGYEQRHQLVVKFVPRARSFMGVVVAVLLTTGVLQAIRLRMTSEGPPGAAILTMFGLHIVFAGVPVAIFALAPKILGKRSPEGLCCDPDAEGPTFKACGVMTTQGQALHVAAISGGWLAVLCAVILAHMH